MQYSFSSSNTVMLSRIITTIQTIFIWSIPWQSITVGRSDPDHYTLTILDLSRLYIQVYKQQHLYLLSDKVLPTKVHKPFMEWFIYLYDR